jgi:hypothetical protein
VLLADVSASTTSDALGVHWQNGGSEGAIIMIDPDRTTAAVSRSTPVVDYIAIAEAFGD